MWQTEEQKRAKRWERMTDAVIRNRLKNCLLGLNDLREVIETRYTGEKAYLLQRKMFELINVFGIVGRSCLRNPTNIEIETDSVSKGWVIAFLELPEIQNRALEIDKELKNKTKL